MNGSTRLPLHRGPTDISTRSTRLRDSTTGGHDASDKEKYEYLLKKLEGVKDRDAKFVSSICCIFPNGDIIRCEGECAGKILLSPRGEGGFGYDPVFMPTGYDKSMAELGTEVKNEISHRANALKIFKKKLREYNGTDK